MLVLKSDASKEILVHPNAISAILPGNLLLIGQFSIKIDGGSINKIKEFFNESREIDSVGANQKPNKNGVKRSNDTKDISTK